MTRGAALVATMLLAGHLTAFAHTYLVRSEPAAGSVIAPPPAALRLTFGSKLEPGFAKMAVARDGAPLTNLPPAQVDATATQVSVVLPQPAPGAYHVSWSVVAKDGHRSAGAFDFKAEAGPE